MYPPRFLLIVTYDLSRRFSKTLEGGGERGDGKGGRGGRGDGKGGRGGRGEGGEGKGGEGSNTPVHFTPGN